MSGPELKPCPFCGGVAEIDKGYVFCCTEGCCAFHKLRRITPEEWNTRATSEADALRAENERLREALKECEADIDGYIWQEYPADHPVHERYRERDFAANPARAALKGGDT